MDPTKRFASDALTSVNVERVPAGKGWEWEMTATHGGQTVTRRGAHFRDLLGVVTHQMPSPIKIVCEPFTSAVAEFWPVFEEMGRVYRAVERAGADLVGLGATFREIATIAGSDDILTVLSFIRGSGAWPINDLQEKEAR